jgi:hypothetical protein
MIDQDEKERLEAMAYNAHLNNLISGLSETDLRNLADKIEARLKGLEERTPLPVVLRAKVHEFANGVKAFHDRARPSQDEVDYFLNKAKHFCFSFPSVLDEMNLVWSWLQENEKRGRFTEEQIQKLNRLRYAMYYEVEGVTHFVKNCPLVKEDGVEGWYAEAGDEPKNNHYLSVYRQKL